MPLTVEQQADLDTAIATIEGLPTPEALKAVAAVIRRSVILQSPDEGLDPAARAAKEHAKQELRRAYAAAVCAEKVLNYLDRLRQVEADRAALGDQIASLRAEADRLFSKRGDISRIAWCRV